jgi:hypothetical protein
MHICFVVCIDYFIFETVIENLKHTSKNFVKLFWKDVSNILEEHFSEGYKLILLHTYFVPHIVLSMLT